jgi:hypothetical protein
LPLHSTASGTDLHEAKRTKEPVRAASTATVTLATPGATLDGVTLLTGDRILLKNQTNQAENGIYVWTGAATLLTRSTDADTASDFVFGWIVYVREGLTNSATHWVYTQATIPTLGTTSLSFAGIGTGSGAIGPQGVPGPPGAVTVIGAPPYMCFQDQKPTNTAGGAFNSGAFQTRTLNTVLSNDLSLAVLVNNQITLSAGTYRCFIRCPAVAVGQHQARLQNITAAATTLPGCAAYSNFSGGTYAQTDSIVSGLFAIRSTTTFEVQHRANTTRATDGFGIQSNFALTEIYTIAEFWLIGGPPPFIAYDWPDEVIDTRYRVDPRARLIVNSIRMEPPKNLLPFNSVGTTTSITNAVGTTAVYTFASPPSVSINTVVTVTGATPSVYNVQNGVVTNVAGNTFSLTIGSSGNADASVQGTVVSL